MANNLNSVVTVEIMGQRYPVRSGLDAGYVSALATYVDKKMQAAADKTPASDSLKTAVLAALNIADEYFRCRDTERLAVGDIQTRVTEIERLVDEALDQFH